MLLIRNGNIYAPGQAGVQDIWVAGGQILAMGKRLEIPRGLECEEIDADGLYVVPGLIDNHVHIAGAGGEGGPGTRTLELPVEWMLESAVTTVIGCLGTDGFTRSIESVLMKAKSLRAQGVSAWMLTGAYQVPSPTLTGDIGRDLSLIDEIIGVGELAISDHRSSCPTVTELARIAAHARVGGMLGGKAGIVNLHMGDARDPFRPIHEVVSHSQLTYTQFLPTHCNRNEWIFGDAKTYGKQGYVDITTSAWPYFKDEEIKPSLALKQLLGAGVPLGNITFSSDGCGSLPSFDEQGRLVKLETGHPSANLREIRESVLDEHIPLETALPVLTSNVARIYKLPRKGSLQQGMDADIAMLDRGLNLVHLVANGKIRVRQGEMVR